MCYLARLQQIQYDFILRKFDLLIDTLSYFSTSNQIKAINIETKECVNLYVSALVKDILYPYEP